MIPIYTETDGNLFHNFAKPKPESILFFIRNSAITGAKRQGHKRVVNLASFTSNRLMKCFIQLKFT